MSLISHSKRKKRTSIIHRGHWPPLKPKLMIIGISGIKGSGKDLVAKIILALTGQPSCFDKYDDSMTEADVEAKIWDVPNFEVKRFADPLKDNLCRILGCTREQLEDREFKETPLPEEWWCYKIGGHLFPRGHYKSEEDHKMAEERYLWKPTPREFLQLMGTEGGRMLLHPNVWVNALFSDYKEQYTVGHTLVDPKIFEGEDYEEDWSMSFPNWIITDVRFPNELEACTKRGAFIIRLERETGNNDQHESETALNDHNFENVIENNGTIKELVEKVKNILIEKKII